MTFAMCVHDQHETVSRKVEHLTIMVVLLRSRSTTIARAHWKAFPTTRTNRAELSSYAGIKVDNQHLLIAGATGLIAGILAAQ
ncbi:hypothetical protein [Brucella cytisi]|uniref:Uncharacterized protein n=1 Tax=Brucella cytisi TaxID=407152 RepID=A0A1J6HE98_9HYPH|nr:hypothetical protein [Brucella cytisi]OIS90825.1 hypothetical protein BLA27_24785 [Brucella cytisi]